MNFLFFILCWLSSGCAGFVPLTTFGFDKEAPGWLIRINCDKYDTLVNEGQFIGRKNFGNWKIGKNFCGFGGDFGPKELNFFQAFDGVHYIQKNVIVRAVGVQNNPTWGIDRIDQRSLPLDNKYHYNDGANGEGVNVYIVDTGIYLEHEDWKSGQAEFLADCSDMFGLCDGGVKGDPHGHGTHCAGTIASPTYGVAKSASVYDLKVLNKEGQGGLFGIMSGIQKIVEHSTENSKVISMSLGAPKNQMLNDAMTAAAKEGVTCVAAAGNEDNDACEVSPASADGVITAGASNIYDERAYFSNYGKCLDVFAPGVNITSLGVKSTDATQVFSGTSMACPHTAGTVATILSANRNSNMEPDKVLELLTRAATPDKIKDAQIGSPNLLIYTEPKMFRLW